jgi:1,4-dihydroxy-2-naphthoate octaprenyltransferase
LNEGIGYPAVAAMGARSTRAAIWLQTARVKSLAISSIAVFLGGAMALYHGEVSWRLLLAWLGSVAIQAGTNLINVSYNYKAGLGTPGYVADPRGSSAPVRMGLLSAAQVRRGALLCFAVGIALGFALVALCGWPILAIGLPAVWAGYSYGAPPLRLGYRGLGVVTVLVFMGLIMVLGSYYVVTLAFRTAPFIAGFAIGLMAAAIMHTNDLRDYAADVAHGKRTLSTLLGRQHASHALLLMIALAYVAVILGAASRMLPWSALLVLLTVARAVPLVRTVYRSRDSAELNVAWFRGVQLHTEFGVLLIAGLLIASLLAI